MGAVPGEQVELVERSRVEQVIDALAGQHLALGVLALDRVRRPGMERLVPPLPEVLDLLLHRIRHGIDAIPSGAGVIHPPSPWRIQPIGAPRPRATR